MSIKTTFKNSISFKLCKAFFWDNSRVLFKDSKILQKLNIFNNQYLSIIFLGLSILSVWYESLFTLLGAGWVESFNLGAIFLFLAFLFCDKRRILSTKSVIYLMLFLFISLVSCLWASLMGLELGMLLIGFLLFCQFVFAFVTASTYKDKFTFINIILVVSLPSLAVGIFQGFFGAATSRLWVSIAEQLVDSRAFAFFSSPNILGSVCMVMSIVAITAWLDQRKWCYLVYTLLAILTLILTFSRSAWLGLAIGIIVALIIKNWKLMAFTPLGFLALLVPSIRQRLLVVFSQSYLVDAALDGRIWSFNNAIEIFKSSPLIGTGPGTYGGQTAIYYDSPIYLRGMQNGYVALPYTDNQWLQVLVQTGVIGALSMGCFFVSHFVSNLRQYIRARQYFSLGIIAATAAIIVNGAFANILEFGAVSILAGAYLGLGGNYEK